jgi:thiol-disulfide isomerase/thioredoxin
MTPSLVLLLKLFIIVLMLHTVWGIIRSVYSRGKIKPGNKKEWMNLLSNAGYLVIAVFIFFMVQRNFQQPLNAVLKHKGQVIKQLSFNNFQANKKDTLSNYKGKVVILNIWATWCGPCRGELPGLNKIQGDFKSNKVTIIALSDENESTIKDYIQKFPVQLIYGNYEMHPLLDSLSARPVSILIDKEGNVRDVVAGARGYQFFSNWIQPYLSK